jgi:hypothetical protein
MWLDSDLRGLPTRLTGQPVRTTSSDLRKRLVSGAAVDDWSVGPHLVQAWGPGGWAAPPRARPPPPTGATPPRSADRVE